MGLSEIHGNILRNINTGRTILIMGKSGSGKTFLSYLLTQSSSESWEFLADDWLLGKIVYIKDSAFLLAGFNPSVYAGSELIKYRTGPGTYDIRFIPLQSKKEFVKIDDIVNLESTGLEHRGAIGEITIDILSEVGIPIKTFKREQQYSERYFEGIVSELSNNSGSATVGSPVKEKTASSVVGYSDKGGIDFRALPIVIQAISNLRLSASSAISLSQLNSISLNQELQEIQKMVDAGIIPSTDRIKEYVQVSCLKGNSDMQKVVSCIADILRLEEERCSPTEATLKDILVVLESGRTTQELRAVFIGG